jgi:hypothetical protein
VESLCVGNGGEGVCLRDDQGLSFVFCESVQVMHKRASAAEKHDICFVQPWPTVLWLCHWTAAGVRV